MNLKIGIVSLGCDKNLVDTETMLSLLNKEGCKITNNPKEADVLIVNTCGFIESAKQESINTLLDMADFKEDGNCKLLIATGCMAQRYKEQIISEMPEVDAVVGTGSYNEIVDVIKKSLMGEKVLRFSDINAPYDIEERVLTTPNYTAYIKIAEGCDNFCTYCIIPKLRGKYRSRHIDSIVSEAENLVKHGTRELNIIAQDTTRYGIDLYGKKLLPELLERLCKIEDLKWIRLLYCYPEGIDDELINIIKKEEKICKYLDIPIQHCNDSILKTMGRRSNKHELENLIQKLKTEIPDISIRTSLIVGFPGETEEQFEELIKFLIEMKLDRVGAFTYSKEEDTPAAKLNNQIPKKVKEQRYEKLMNMQQNIAHEQNMRFIGQEIDVLVEGIYEDTFYYGRTYRDAPDVDGLVYFYSSAELKPGDFVKVKISEVNEYDLTGEIVDEFAK